MKNDCLIYVTKFSCFFAVFVCAIFVLFHADSHPYSDEQFRSSNHAKVDYDQYVGLSHWAGPTVEIDGAAVVLTQPFADRVLAPLMTHWIKAFWDQPYERILKILNLTIWLSIGPIVGWYLWKKGVSFPQATVIATIPYPAVAATHYLIPDSLSVALLLLVILGLEMGATLIPTVAAALQMLARNSSLLTILVWLAARREEIVWRRICAIVAAAVFGLVALVLIRPFPADNIHHLNAASYLLLKLPINFLRNLFFVNFYVDTFDWCNGSAPFVVFNVSRLHFLGSIHKIGLCSPDTGQVLITALTMLLVLGVFPYLALLDIRRRFAQGKTIRSELHWHAPEWSFLFFFALTPALGTAAPRLAMDAYVLLVPLTPILLARRTADRRQLAVWQLINLVGAAILGHLSGVLW